MKIFSTFASCIQEYPSFYVYITTKAALFQFYYHLLLFKFYYLYAFLIFFQGETNQGNQKIYQRTVGRKIFMLFHINLNPFSMNVFKTFFLIACFWFFPYFMGNIFIFYVYLSTHNFFYTLFLQDSFTLMVDLAFRLPNCLIDLPRNVPRRKFLD